MSRTLEQFQAEINEARRKLKVHKDEIGGFIPAASDEGRLKANFDLPYSSMPETFLPKWSNDKKLD